MIREEYKNAFLDEKNKKVVMIEFTESGEIIDASQIVDQGSFKYVESLNENDGIKLGYSGSTYFEIDIKGDLTEEQSKEVYVELIAYVESDEEVKMYPVPIGYFIISNIDYDYQTEVSHLLCYSKLTTDLSSGKVKEIVGPSGYLYLTNYVINVISDGLIPKEYIDKTEIISVRKELTSDVYMLRKNYNVYKRVEYGTYQHYLTEEVVKYQVCIYHFDENYKRNYDKQGFYQYTLLFFEWLSDESAQTYYRTEVTINGHQNIVNTFWKNNPNYNYDSPPSDYSTRYTYGELKPQNMLRIDGSDNSLFPYYYNTRNYKLSVIRGDSDSLYSICYTGVGYRSKAYTSANYDDGLSQFDYNFNGVNWVETASLITDPSYFQDFNVRYIKSQKYGDISEVTSNVSFGDMSVFDFVSDFAEINGEILKLNRETGLYMSYTLMDSDGEYPSEHIYPLESLYPRGDKNVVHINKDMYSQLIKKIKQSKKVGRVLMKKGSTEYVSQVDDFNENEYMTIEIDGNIFVTLGIVETSVTDTILNKYKGFEFIPFELECTGLPWLESGDWIIVETDDGQERLNVNRRTLSGIQGMMDSLSSGGI